MNSGSLMSRIDVRKTCGGIGSCGIFRRSESCYHWSIGPIVQRRVDANYSGRFSAEISDAGVTFLDEQPVKCECNRPIFTECLIPVRIIQLGIKYDYHVRMKSLIHSSLLEDLICIKFHSQLFFFFFFSVFIFGWHWLFFGMSWLFFLCLNFRLVIV